MPPRKRKQVVREETTATTDQSTSSTIEPAKMTVVVLKEELDSRGLDTRGKKAELVARLQAELIGSSKGSSPTKKSRKGKSEPKPEEEEPEVRIVTSRDRHSILT